MGSQNVIRKQADDYEAIAMSYHEASHSIVGLLNFISISDVHIMSHKSEDGETSYLTYQPNENDNKFIKKLWLIFEIQMLYAGMVGEKTYYKNICGSDKFPMHLRIGSASDIKEAAKLINQNNLVEPGKTRLLFKKKIQKSVQEILLEYWDDVQLVAHLLYKHKELKFEELKYALTRNSINRDFWKKRFKELLYLYSEKEIEEKQLKEIILQDKVVIF